MQEKGKCFYGTVLHEMKHKQGYKLPAETKREGMVKSVSEIWHMQHEKSNKADHMNSDNNCYKQDSQS